MYDYINGIISAKSNTSKGTFVTIEAGGIGYLCEITPRDYNRIEGKNAKIYTVLIHREDKMSLCGFLQKEDRDIFNIFTSVSGVGSKMAMTLINEFEVSVLVGLVIDGNYKALTAAKGVGPKLAQKIILELKDKLINYQEKEPIVIENIQIQNNQATEDAQAVLLSLGYERDEIKSAMTKTFSVLKNNSSAEEILKSALKILSAAE